MQITLNPITTPLWNTTMSTMAGVRESLSYVDTAWLRMDRPTNLMMICGMLTFEDRLDLARVKEVVATRMLCFHRFRQRIVEQGGNPFWENDPEFDLSWHVRHIAVPHTAHALEDAVSDLVSTPLDRGRPMWQFHLIDDQRGGSALVLRIHHCYADGFALIHVLSCMTDTAPTLTHETAGDVGDNGNGVQRAAWERIFGPVSETMGDALRSAQSLFGIGQQLLANPLQVAGYARTGVDLAREAAYIATMKPDSHTRFKGPLGVMKRAAWAQPLSLFEVKAIAEAFACSVNDVLLACVTGALRSYLLARGDAVDGLDMRALVPVNMRPPGPITDLGNHFGMVFLDLPLGVEDRAERVLAVKRRMDELKHSQQPTVALGILMSMGMVPDAIREKTLEALAANASAVITNVRGTSEARFFAGKRIVRQVFWVPQSGGIGMGISILSYDGKVDFGVMSDVRRVPDPELIVTSFAAEFEALLTGALLMPWPRRPGAAHAHGSQHGAHPHA
ncbi:WS/DGAT/MGAT family O-acyltransferase [Noviherbaspirillum autotrophicum]|uniref:WS/DGAT/MGAT family O-acyltransferase n=1 Tax=Noviherbaspirillum autotrophicum TaxID=709839 RepID=UPI0006938843|nr:wax ester/triacylglycerol synthase family O-acyltransferase [Noviherbaspirillum autotrophicum]